MSSFYAVFNWAAMKITECVATGAKAKQEMRAETVERMLARGTSDREICALLQLNTKELAAIKRELKK